MQFATTVVAAAADAVHANSFDTLHLTCFSHAFDNFLNQNRTEEVMELRLEMVKLSHAPIRTLAAQTTDQVKFEFAPPVGYAD